MKEINDLSMDREDLISDQDLYAVMMRKVWLDNALTIACQEVCHLLEEITNSSEEIEKKLRLSYRKPSFKKVLTQEWENKDIALGHLADLLVVARQQIRLESQIICEDE